MREDMFKVIVERPRGGWRTRPHKRPKVLDEDDACPRKIGVKRHVAEMGIGSKSLNENLQPLKRYLGRQVGRRWNDVYSEIAATLAPGHTVKEHVHLHLKDFVMQRVLIGADGELTAPSVSGWHRSNLAWHEDYYVDPRDGVLKSSEALWRARGLDPNPWWRPKDVPDPNVRKLDETHELRRIAGVWYEITYVLEPDWPTDQLVYCLVQRTLVRRKTPYAVAKRQLCGAELKAHGIANQPVN
jgi:hypothetical protein